MQVVLEDEYSESGGTALFIDPALGAEDTYYVVAIDAFHV